MNEMPPLVPKRTYRRPPKSGREHYGTTHQKLRKQLLASNPLCAYLFDGCTGWATEADHKVYPAKCIEDYVPTCAHCHRIKTKTGRVKPT